MSDIVKAEVQAVRQLRKAVSRYAEQMRDAVSTARREMAAADAKVRDEVEQRRGRLNRANQDLQRVCVALAHCQENCGGLQRAVADAEQRVAKAGQALDRARKAAQITSTTSSELLKSLQSAEAIIGEQSSAASSALASLDGKLSEITGGRIGSVVHNAITTIGIAAQITVSTMDVINLAGEVSQGRLPIADYPTSMSEMRESSPEHQQQLWNEVEIEARKRDVSDEDTIA